MHDLFKFPISLSKFVRKFPAGKFEVTVREPAIVADNEHEFWLYEEVLCSIQAALAYSPALAKHAVEDLNILTNCQGTTFAVLQTQDSFRVLEEIPKEYLLPLLGNNFSINGKQQ